MKADQIFQIWAFFVPSILGLLLFCSTGSYAEDSKNETQYFVLESGKYPGFYLATHFKKLFGSPNNCWTDAQMWRDHGDYGNLIQFKIKILKNGTLIPLEKELDSLKKSVATLEARSNDINAEENNQLLWEKLDELETKIQEQSQIMQLQQEMINDLQNSSW